MFTTELKKTAQMQKNNYHILKLDELYWFNNTRIHGALNYLSPVQFKALHLAK